ncbi:hypothetical protein N4239_11720 [Brachyspira hyodysenteriae]|uniref:hypothetical protein n=1 Tax=Brachyspira hyodysenteriae TaxID=159 RepID=UPI002B25B525|nr:hypothetical protein [Brachyspira hyodysenteriae]WPC23601.1 hypothetical protein N4239_11720 [Brachyspira hyodysenteriae]
MFKLIKEPTENPSNLLDSYRQQNIIMQKMRMLHTAFDGIKLNHWNDTDRELPDILAGSICEFEGRLFETNQTIKLTDNISSGGTIKQDLRFIKLVIVRDSNNKDNDYLRAEIAGGYSETVGNGFPTYDYENRGFYNLDSNGKAIEKYLRISMKYDSNLGGYVEKKYWNINDINRKGQTLKRKTVNFGVGTHEFNFPSDVNSITVHICSGGGGGYYGILDTAGTAPTVGGDSKILINDKSITTCTGGGILYKTGSGALDIAGGKGGVASGQGKLINGNNGTTTRYDQKNPNTGAVFSNNTTLASGGNGGNGSIAGYGSAGGGSGSAAIVDVTRGMLGSSSKIKIVVGTGGNGGTNSNSNGVVANGEKGQDGSAVIEYMQK